MWQQRQRLARLEKEAVEARAAQADLQRRLEVFEKIAAAAGADLTDTVPEPPVPAPLLAAALEPSRNGSPVRLAVDGEDVIAVIGDEGGNPREWWAAIHQLANRLGSAS
jgi:hypothetical protein